MSAGGDTRTFVVGHDASSRGDDALVLAQDLALLFDARLLVIHVSRAADERSDTPRLSAERLVTAVPWQLRQVVARSAAGALREVAEAVDAELLIVGSTHRAALGRVHPGSVGEQLLHQVPCPVATAPLGHAGVPDRDVRVVAAGYDTSVESEVAVELAAAVARRAEATLRLITVVEPASTGVLAGAGAPWAGLGATLPDDAGRLRQALSELRDRMPPELRADSRLLHGRAADGLLAEAELGVDLLVVGSRGLGTVARMLGAGVTHEVMLSAPCPVLVVPRAALVEVRPIAASVPSAAVHP